MLDSSAIDYTIRRQSTGEALPGYANRMGPTRWRPSLNAPYPLPGRTRAAARYWIVENEVILMNLILPLFALRMVCTEP